MLTRVMLCFLGKVEGVSRGIAVIHSEIKPPLFLGWAITSSGSSASTRSYLFLNEEFFTLVLVHFLLPFLCCKIIWSSESESSDLTYLLRLGLKIKIVSLTLEFYAMLLTKSNHQYQNYKSWSFRTFYHGSHKIH